MISVLTWLTVYILALFFCISAVIINAKAAGINFEFALFVCKGKSCERTMALTAFQFTDPTIPELLRTTLCTIAAEARCQPILFEYEYVNGINYIVLVKVGTAVIANLPVAL